MQKKIALFGGTFDPVHLGHTLVAASAAEQICTEKVTFIPAKHSPLKGFFPTASDTDRLKMIELAISEEKSFVISDFELTKPAPSYTLETVRHFKTEYGSETLIFWLIGADSINDLIHWYGIVELIDECNIATMHRAGCKKPDFAQFKGIWGPRRIEKLQQNIIPTPLVDISSTEIRSRITAGMDVTNMLHPAVADYIFKNGLYK